MVSLADEKSKEFAKKKLLKRIKLIFELLDSDKDEKISARKINMNSLHPQMIKIIKPLLQEMEDKRKTYGFEEFSTEI